MALVDQARRLVALVHFQQRSVWQHKTERRVRLKDYLTLLFFPFLVVVGVVGLRQL